MSSAGKFWQDRASGSSSKAAPRINRIRDPRADLAEAMRVAYSGNSDDLCAPIVLLLLPASASEQLPTCQQLYLCSCYCLLCPARRERLLLPAAPCQRAGKRPRL